MACCLMAPSHYLNQHWLIISELSWYLPEGNFIGNTEDIYPSLEFKSYWFKSAAASPVAPVTNMV